MTLNFGHTFAHAIEAKSKFSKKITHGEAVLSGMILETKLSVLKNICAPKTLSKIKNIYLIIQIIIYLLQNYTQEFYQRHLM